MAPENDRLNSRAGDPFSPIAGHYDTIMEHVNYGRWSHIAESLASLLPRPLMHLDAACGTGLLMEHLRHPDWHSTGIDLSAAMLDVAKRRRGLANLARADLCALPFRETFHLITCLFDSMNFLLHEDHICTALLSLRQALLPDGILYFDMVTHKMIADHFNNESWTERHGNFRSSWRSTYDQKKHICETRVRVNTGRISVTQERVYAVEFLCDAIQSAGLRLLAMRNAYTWGAVNRQSPRIDFVAVKQGNDAYDTRFQEVEQRIKRDLKRPKR